MMDYDEAVAKQEDNDAIIVKADEVDEAGADISAILPTDTIEAEFSQRIELRRAQDAQKREIPKTLANTVSSSSKSLPRPILRRDGSSPLPPQQPPQSASPQQGEEIGNPSDSLTLMQLKRLVTDLPKLDPAAYAFDYQDTGSIADELGEWFQYTEEERCTLLRAKESFDEKWRQARKKNTETSRAGRKWTEADPIDRENFIRGTVQGLSNSEASTRIKNLECISYISLGVWAETAGLSIGSSSSENCDSDPKAQDSRHTKFELQLKWICKNARLLCKTGAIQALAGVLYRSCEGEQWVTQSYAIA